MAQSTVSEGRSADSTLTFDQMEVVPFYNTSDRKEPAPVWKHSDYMRDILAKKNPDKVGKDQLIAALEKQIPTLSFYSWLVEYRKNVPPAKSVWGKNVSFYVILFPGEAKDNTGLKDLNDKVLGYTRCTEYIEARKKAIQNIFNSSGEGFIVAGQNFKAAYIYTMALERKHFVDRLKELDTQLRNILLIILPKARDEARKDTDIDEETRNARLIAIKDLEKKLGKKDYQFDIFFGLATRSIYEETPIQTVFLLLTETLKAASMARVASKGQTLHEDLRKLFVTEKVDDLMDSRGKKFDWNRFIYASLQALKIKESMLKLRRGLAGDFYNLVIDEVWTGAFLINDKFESFGNPDVIRDVRKKLVREPKLRQGINFNSENQKKLLEFWLVILNLSDLVKDFLKREFQEGIVKNYHDTAHSLSNQLYGKESYAPDFWQKLEHSLTHDLRNVKITVAGTASEFEFYSFAADRTDLIFFSMDIRDLGVDLMMWYEESNREIQHTPSQYHDSTKLMEETFRSSDPINLQKRFTYEKVRETFEKYANSISEFRRGHSHPMVRPKPQRGSDFEESPPDKEELAARERDTNWKSIVQETKKAFGNSQVNITLDTTFWVMLGGDEVFVAAQPIYAAYVHEIIRDLDQIRWWNGTLNMRASISYSSADRDKDPIKQKENNWKAHDQTMELANKGPGKLKKYERAHRQIERLIAKLEANPKKKAKAPAYMKDLEKLGLMKMFVRVKYGNAKILSRQKFIKLLKFLEEENFSAAEKSTNVKIELIDFTGKLRDEKKLSSDLEKLLYRLNRDVGGDNFQVNNLLVITKLPKIIEDILDWWTEKAYPRLPGDPPQRDT